MAHEKEESGAGVLLAFIAGAAVGAAVALLYAPAAGAETREAVNRRARESRDKVIEALRQGRGILHVQRDNVLTAFDQTRDRKQDA